MSWSEVKKINTDLKTPINYLMYISDIKAYGANSYVFKDISLLTDLLLHQSDIAWKDTTVKTQVINNVSDTDLEYIFNRDTRFGEHMNTWYGTNVFENGKIIDNVENVQNNLSAITDSKANTVVAEIIDSLVFTRDGIGAYLCSTYSIEDVDLQSCDTFADITENTNAIKALFDKNETLRTNILNSYYATSNLLGSQIFADLIVSDTTYWDYIKSSKHFSNVCDVTTYTSNNTTDFGNSYFYATSIVANVSYDKKESSRAMAKVWVKAGASYTDVNGKNITVSTTQYTGAESGSNPSWYSKETVNNVWCKSINLITKSGSYTSGSATASATAIATATGYILPITL